ncbi:MAG TPA: hypothetical protein PKY86_04075 [Niabella sp.]|nr:hypothetical protein [Niabella sp.]HQW14568.1 hypothetical protein [Niabella sp.]HQX19709.1 hypothetical protein [Niabella sp.]HQX42760.1 hypothetical protein [Niabella sp.]HRB07554.1 hypothetical protein [Niabella sp.]
MKKLLFSLGIPVMMSLMIASCIKKDKTPPCTPNTITRDRQVIDSAALNKGWNLVWDYDKSVYYEIVNPGSGSTPSTDSLVAFTAIGETLSGVAIANATAATATYPLSYYNDLMLTYSLLQLKKGGVIRIVIPSSLNGYGCNQVQLTNGTTVPGNSQFIYTITLTDVKKP